MLSGTVIGLATSTTKHPSMEGWKLLIVQPYQTDGKTPDGFPLLAIDAIGAGVGTNVLISSDGKGTRQLMNSETTPVRWSVIGISDQ